jgi:hypothetical protein
MILKVPILALSFGFQCSEDNQLMRSIKEKMSLFRAGSAGLFNSSEKLNGIESPLSLNKVHFLCFLNWYGLCLGRG